MLNLQLTLAARYLWGRKLRTFLTTLAIVFGTLVIFGMNLLMPTMMESFQTNMMAVSGQVDITITQKSGESFQRNVMNRLRTISGVKTIAGSLSRTVNIPDGYYGHAKISALTLTGIDPKAAQTIRNYPVREGRFLRSADTANTVISASLADNLGVKLDDEFSLPTTEGDIDLRVIGILPARALPGNEEVLVTLEEAQKLLDLPNRINTIEVNLNTMDEAERALISQNITDILGDNYSLGALSSGAEILGSIKMGQALLNLFGFLSLFMGGFIIFNTFRTIIAERRHDIGMLRALGASRSTILGLILTEGLVQGAVGTLAGIGLGYVMGAGLLRLMGPMMTQFIHVEMGAPIIQPWLVVITVFLGVGVTLLAGLIPAFRASRITPLEALRPSLSEAVQHTAIAGVIIGVLLIAVAIAGLLTGNTGFTALGGLLFLVGLTMVAPALIKPITAVLSVFIAIAFARDGAASLAQGNLVRQPSRSAITASATMIGLATIVGIGGMIWSLSGSFLDMLRRSLGSDYLIMPPSVALWKSNVGARSDLADRIHSISGVEYVATMRFAAAEANGKAVSLLGIDPLVYPKVASLTFQQGDSQTAFTALENERALIANGIFASQAGIRAGDMVRLSTPTGEKMYRIIAIASDYLNAKVLTAYISQDNLQKDFRKSEDVFFQINLIPNADVAAVETRLKDVLEDYPQFKLISGKSYFEENKQLFNAVFSVYFILLAFLATPSLIAMINTLAISVIERTREIGMLRAIGATRKQVRRMVIAEALLLAAIGTAFGLLAGLYLGYLIVLGMSSSGFPITYVFPYTGLVVATATGLIFGVLAALTPARQAAGMDIIRALRYE